MKQTFSIERQGENGRLGLFLKISIVEGVFGQIFSTLAGPGSAFLTKFAIMLNATPLQFGILSAIGQLSQIFQPIGAVITKRRLKRKPIVLPLQFSGRAIALLYGVLPFVLLTGDAMTVFLLLFLISISLQSIADNAWIGWISDLVPVGARGHFFSLRSQYLMVTAVAAGYAFSIFIDWFAAGGMRIPHLWYPLFLRTGRLALGFSVIFIAAAAAGFAGSLVLSRQPEKSKEIEAEGVVQMFVLPFRDVNFRKFLFYNCWWMAAVGIGAPFWQPFMMKKLGMSLFEVQIYGSINIVASLAVLRLWGRLIDAYGNRAAMRLIILLGGFNPMVWLFVTRSTYHILYLEAVTSGIMWAGAGLVATNFSLSVAPKDKRQLYAGIANAVSGLAMMTTMLLSGAFLPRNAVIVGFRLDPEQVLFALTGIARWSTQIPLSLVREPGARPVSEAIYSFIRQIRPRILK
jgi:hypothetical protein